VKWRRGRAGSEEGVRFPGRVILAENAVGGSKRYRLKEYIQVDKKNYYLL
jgi:hypothetical protein